MSSFFVLVITGRKNIKETECVQNGLKCSIKSEKIYNNLHLQKRRQILLKVCRLTSSYFEYNNIYVNNYRKEISER